jgi:hypothetical protein
LIFGFVWIPLTGSPVLPLIYSKYLTNLLLTSLPTRLSMIYASQQPIPLRKSCPMPGLESRFDACCPISGFHQRRNPRCQKFGILKNFR